MRALAPKSFPKRWLRDKGIRDRAEDIPILIRHFMHALGKSDAFARVPEEAFHRLQTHPWPGNVRELSNLVEVALAYDKGGRVDLAGYLDEMLPQSSRVQAAPRSANDATQVPAAGQTYPAWLDDAHRVYFSALYE